MKIIAYTRSWEKTLNQIDSWKAYYGKEKMELWADHSNNMDAKKQAKDDMDKCRGLLKNYDWVIITDPDEFILPNPLFYSSLTDYIEKLDKDFVVATGYELIDGELQRNNIYDKLVITHIVPECHLGMHTKSESNPPINDPHLFLLHMKYYVHLLK
jgi:hypothetical protein